MKADIGQLDKHSAARLDDLIRTVGYGRIVSTRFMTPAEQILSASYLMRNAPTVSFCFDGGYRGAERRTLVLFGDGTEVLDGDYLVGNGCEKTVSADFCFDGRFDDDVITENELRSILGDSMVSVGTESVGMNDDICALRIRGSGYHALEHRAFMGSVLSLGIARETIGDISVYGDCDAVIFACRTVADFMLSLEKMRIGGDVAEISVFHHSDNLDVCRKYRKVNIFSSSDRIDSLVCELAGISREKAKKMIHCGEVLRNWFEVDAPDERVSTGDVVTVRGIGKYVIGEFGSQTRHGRTRITAYKYS